MCIGIIIYICIFSVRFMRNFFEKLSIWKKLKDKKYRFFNNLVHDLFRLLDQNKWDDRLWDWLPSEDHIIHDLLTKETKERKYTTLPLEELTKWHCLPIEYDTRRTEFIKPYKDVANTIKTYTRRDELDWCWSPEAIALEEKLNGRIRLRFNKKWVWLIDFYNQEGELICKGLQRLWSNDKTISNRSSIVQWSRKDKHWNQGVVWISYFDLYWAIDEAEKQKLQLCLIRKIKEKIEELLDSLWSNTEERLQSCRTLFGTGTGFFDRSKEQWEREDLLYVGLSNWDLNDDVYTLVCDFSSKEIFLRWDPPGFPQPYRVSEDWYPKNE